MQLQVAIFMSSGPNLHLSTTQLDLLSYLEYIIMGVLCTFSNSAIGLQSLVAIVCNLLYIITIITHE